MEDWDSKLDVFLRFNDAEILQDKIQNEVIALHVSKVCEKYCCECVILFIAINRPYDTVNETQM